MLKFAPVVLFVYNRPNYLIQTLEALSNNEESKESLLFIYCDGPKQDASELDLLKIKEARKIANSKQWFKEVQIIERESNLGLSNSIISGVNEIIERFNRVIVLEDDLVVSPFFLNYMNKALDKYQNIDDLISVVGHSYPINFSDTIKETFFIKNAECLGWGTWKRGWDLFELDAHKLIEQLEKNDLVAEFNFNNQYPYFKMLKLVAEGKVNSWAIRWYATSFIHNKLTLFPKKSLVRHIGDEGSNIKADNSDLFGWELSKYPISYFENELSENSSIRLLLSLHFKKFNRRRLSIHSFKYAVKRFILPLFFNK